jgi:hypothetical protein
VESPIPGLVRADAHQVPNLHQARAKRYFVLLVAAPAVFGSGSRTSAVSALYSHITERHALTVNWKESERHPSIRSYKPPDILVCGFRNRCGDCRGCAFRGSLTPNKDKG